VQSTESTAVVAWIGYAAPSWRQVPFATRARAGGRLLTADLAALDAGRTADGGDPAHVTLVGHSYGSTVVGAALRSGPKRADDLVLLGSPGVLADDVSQLGMSGRRVYVGEAPFDPVADLGAFGADPGDPGFGATAIKADPEPGLCWPERLSGAHSRYFDPGSESLRNVARVVVGRGSAATRPEESA
jgi:pimeloyl-ACP methyl ester carboxylesterase